MNVCLAYPDYPPVYPVGVGDAKYVQRLAENLCLNGVDVSVLTSRTTMHPEICSPQMNLTIYPVIEDWSLRGIRDNHVRLRELFKRIRPDAINIVYPAPRLRGQYVLPYFMKMVAGRIPIITTLFHFFPKNSSVLYKAMAPLLYFSSTRIHFHDDCLMGMFNTAFPFFRRKAFFIPVGNLVEVNGASEDADKDQLKRSLGLDTECDYISFMGYWYPGKGVDILLKALDRLKRKGRSVRLLLVGGRSKADMYDYEEDVLRQIDDLGLHGDVMVTEHCSDEKMVEYLLCSEMAVFPFRNNRMVMGRSSIMLPIALQVPIVVTRPAKPSTYLHDGENVLMVSPGDVDGLVEGIDRLLSDESLRQSMRIKLKALADDISWASISRQWLNTYRGLHA